MLLDCFRFVLDVLILCYIYVLFSKYFFEGDANHFIQAANNLADDFLRNNFIIKSAVNENIFYQEFDRKEHAVN